MNLAFHDRVVLVTGGATGIGRAICDAFAAAGARIAVVALDVSAGTRTAEQLRAGGAAAMFIHADVTDAESVRRYVRGTMDAYGRIDVFCNNAGTEGVVAALTEYPEEAFDRVMAVNARGVFLGLKFVLPVMMAQRAGVVVNTGSTGSHVGATGVCAYIASKHAVLGLTRAAAQSLTEQRSNSDQTMQLATPNGRIAEPEEIAASVLFLASDHARHMVGQSLILDGGRLAQ
jgi:3alpha(or 20beta)-hydroxysteroid dehydrogenase